MAKEARQGSRSKATRKGDLKKGDSSIGGTSNLFKEMNVSVEKRRDGKRQELRRQHQLQTKEAEEGIRDAFRVNKSAFDQYRSSRMGKLSELVKKRSELELQIITLLQSTKDRYEATNSGITASLEKRLANLR